MKFLILLSLISVQAKSEILKISPGDEAKLGEFISKLPLEVRTLRIEKFQTPRPGRMEKSVFPNAKGPFNVFCESIYYLNSKIASSIRCELNLDILNPEVEENYDEYKLVIQDASIVTAMFSNISYGRTSKEFRSMDFRNGINFDGKNTYIFPYFFKCTESECVLKFSK